MDIFRKAELRPSDVSRLLKVSRVAVSMWFNGHSRPHIQLSEKVEKLAEATKSALVAGELPLLPGVPRRERHMFLERIIKKHTK